jgi:vitamin B12 transporter
MRQTTLALALGIAVPAFAHASATPDTLGDPIVVTATRTPQPVSQAIGDITVISARDIAEAGQTTLLELLQEQPGVEITQYGGAGAAADIRIRGGNPGHTLVLIDGLRVGSATSGTTPLENIALDQIDHIEILRGPASSLYGADAVTGVVQIFTRQSAGGAPKLSARAGGGSAGLAQGNADYSGQLGATRFSLGAGASRTNNGFSSARPGTFGYNPDDDGDEKYSAHLSLEHALSDEQRIGIRGLYNRDRVEYDAGTSNDYAINSVNNLSAWWQGRLAANWHSHLQIGQGQNHTNNFSLGSSTGTFNTDQTQYQWQNDLNLPLGNVSASLERLEQKVDASQTAFSQTHRTVNAAQLGYQLQLGRHALQASVRHDDYSDFGGQTTGMLGYGFDFTSAWRATASVGTAFKAPTFNDLYYPLSFGYQGNPNLKPEKARNAELSLRYQDGVNQFSATAYRNRVRDLIAYVFTLPVSSVQNVDRAALDGVTLAAHTELAGVRIQANYDWQNAVDEATQKTLPYRARHYGTLDVSKALGKWELGAAVVAADKRFTDVSNVSALKGYARLDLRANYRLDTEWRVLARINNALDADYSLRDGYNTPGINGFLGVEYRQR